ncbi:SRPBCC domain-containing protein [Cryobacterium sp. GrIS_2_6]|uniref:SRPBCC domain-containing protein n=1 Tax=Cryobacterium sp. GrIS_2_6 TaxID=3162785 RepID=UPI002E0A628B|nr:uncharacterized protein YndB with AHSA1/START domain [Cryobacterium psychrotolerans]
MRASPERVYETWLSSTGDTAMTGTDASIDARVGGDDKAWDGYITGQTLVLDPGHRIMQSWRYRPTHRSPGRGEDSEHRQARVAFETPWSRWNLARLATSTAALALLALAALT